MGIKPYFKSEEMPKMTGWKCETLTYETSMHKITTQKGVILISTHVDDCDAACSHPPDAIKLREVANKLFSQGNQQGIKVVRAVFFSRTACAGLI
jgi:hypothetical protein